MVIISKPFFYWDELSRTFLNLKGKRGRVKYSNLKGSMIIFENKIEVFVPRDALKKA